MKRTVIIFFHLAYWVLYTSLFLFLLYLTRGEKGFVDSDGLIYEGLGLVTGLISFYSVYHAWFPYYLVHRRIKEFIAMSLASFIMVALLATFMIAFLVYQIVGILPEPEVWILLAAGFFILAMVHGIAATAIRGALYWYDEIRINDELQKQHLQSQLTVLKGQLQPHFLFNTINNIDVLIERSPHMASQYLQQLSSLLRYLLYKGELHSIALEEELQFIGQYLGLQSLRKAVPDWIYYNVEGNPQELSVAPLLFLPLLENACKHGFFEGGKGKLTVHFFIEDTCLRFECQNPVDPHRQQSGIDGGLGLSLVRRRLELLYPGLHSLEIRQIENIFKVQCRIPLERR